MANIRGNGYSWYIMAQSGKHLSLYRQIFNTISEQIRCGELSRGERLPSEAETAQNFGVSRITSKRALQMLSDAGLITRVPGRGSFVAERKENATSRTALIALVIEDFADSFGNKLIYAVEEYCRENGLRLLLYRSRWDVAREEAAVRDAVALGAAGLLVMPVHGEFYSDAYLKLVLDRFPIVFVDRHLKGLEASFVGTDNVAAARRAANYLFDLGHRKVAWICPAERAASTIRDRELGVVQAHAERGIPIDRDLWITGVESIYADFMTREFVADERECIRRHLAEHPEITAVFAEEYGLAVIVREAAEALGRCVPHDLSIITFDACYGYPYTHIQQQEFEMGTRAASILHRQIQSQGKPEQVLLAADLIEGASTAAVPRF